MVSLIDGITVSQKWHAADFYQYDISKILNVQKIPEQKSHATYPNKCICNTNEVEMHADFTSPLK